MRVELATAAGVVGAIVAGAAADSHNRYIPAWMALGYVLPAIYMLVGELAWRMY